MYSTKMVWYKVLEEWMRKMIQKFMENDFRGEKADEVPAA